MPEHDEKAGGKRKPNLAEMEATCREIGRAIARGCPPEVGFCLVLFDFHSTGEGFSTYVSNAEPEQMVKALRELADKRERRLRETGK